MGGLLAILIENWVVISLIGSVVFIIIGWIFFGISPFLPFKERRRRQEVEDFRNSVVAQHLELGDIFLNSSLLEAARREFEEALKSDPNNVQAKSGLMKAEIYDRSDDQDPLVTKRRIEFLLKKNPKDKHALLNLGIIYTHVDSARAIRYLEQALEQDSSLVAAYLNLGYLYEQNGDHDKALIMNEKALEKAEWHRQALNNAGYHYVRRGDYGKAVECLTKLSKLDPSSNAVQIGHRCRSAWCADGG